MNSTTDPDGRALKFIDHQRPEVTQKPLQTPSLPEKVRIG
jgi:hypothetical protein